MHAKKKITNGFFGKKCNFTRRSNVGMVITFVVVERFNRLIKISFVIICFGLHRKVLQSLKTTFFYQTSDVDGDYGGTHNSDDIYMKI
jgi:hypothetical protein